MNVAGSRPLRMPGEMVEEAREEGSRRGKRMKLTVLIPAFNERDTIREILRRVAEAAIPMDKEIIVIDDGSSDGTAEILSEMAKEEKARGKGAGGQELKVISHSSNQGKGAAIKTGLREATGDIVVIQDADLEYDPSQYGALLAPFEDEKVKVVYGSRNLRENPRSSLIFRWGGIFLSKLTNLLYGAGITDEATGYKAFRRGVLESLDLESQGFEFCPEVTAKLCRRGYRIREVPISYFPRPREEGKKITWKDGLTAIRTLFRYRFS